MARIGIDVRLTYYRRGGIAEYMRQLTRALADLHPSHTFLTLHNFRAGENLPFQRANCLTPCHHRFEALALGAEIFPHRLDLLHSPDFIPPRWGARQYVITVHDLAFLLYADIQTPESLRYYAGQIRRAVKQAARIIAVSQTTKDDLTRLLNVPAEKIQVIPEGVNSAYRVMEAGEREAILAPLNLPSDYILFVGTLEPRKNLPNLLTAYASLPDAPPLILAGEKGWLSDPIFAAIDRLNLSGRVRWLGGVGIETLPALYNGASVHVLPSLYEGFGFPPLEAMACGTPTLISDRGSLREIGGEAATYCDPDSPESIAAGLEKLLSDSAYAESMRAKGLTHAAKFTWIETAQQTLTLYQSLLD